MSALSDHLNEVARTLKLSGRQFGEAAGISKASAARYLSGTHTPSRELLRRMANNLNKRYPNSVKYETLLGLAKLQPDNPPFTVPRAFDKLSWRQRRLLIRTGWEFLGVSEDDDDDSPDTPDSNGGVVHADFPRRRVTETRYAPSDGDDRSH